MKKGTKFLLELLLMANVTSLHAQSCKNIERKAEGFMRKADTARYTYDATKFYAKANFWMTKTVSCQNRKIMKELRTMTPSVTNRPMRPQFKGF